MHSYSYKAIMVCSLVLNYNIFRIFYAKLFGKAWTFSQAADPVQFHRPIRLFSFVFTIAICIPNVLLNCYYLGFRQKGPFWSTQMQMTMFELVILCLIMTGLVIYERMFIKYRL